MKKAIFFLIFGAFAWATSPAQVVNGGFTTNTSNPNLFNPTRAFNQGRVLPWRQTHGDPTTVNYATNPYAYMWSAGNHGEGIYQPMTFSAGCYQFSLKIRTANHGVNDPNVNDAYIKVGTAAHLYPSGSTHNPMIQPTGSTHGWATTLHHVIQEQAGQFMGPNWHTITGMLNVTAPWKHNMILIYPHMPAASTNGSRLEMMVDDVQVTPVGLGVSQFHFENQSGQPQSSFQVNEPVFLDGSACQFEEKYFIDIRSRPLGTINPGPFTNQMLIGWTVGQIGTLNLTALAAQHGFSFSSGMEYQVKVAIQNQPCFNWTESTQVFQVPHSNPLGGYGKSAAASDVLKEFDADDISLFPNPATDEVWLEMPAEMGDVIVEILTVDGKRVAVQQLADAGGNRQSLDISQLPAGSYVVLLQANERAFRKRLTIVGK